VFHFFQGQVFCQCWSPVWTRQLHNIAFNPQPPAVKPFSAKDSTSFTTEDWALTAKSKSSIGSATKDDDTLRLAEIAHFLWGAKELHKDFTKSNLTQPWNIQTPSPELENLRLKMTAEHN